MPLVVSCISLALHFGSFSRVVDNSVIFFHDTRFNGVIVKFIKELSQYLASDDWNFFMPVHTFL